MLHCVFTVNGEHTEIPKYQVWQITTMEVAEAEQKKSQIELITVCVTKNPEKQPCYTQYFMSSAHKDQCSNYLKLLFHQLILILMHKHFPQEGKMQKSMGKEPENEINDMQKNDAVICIPEFTMANYTARTNANVFCASMVVLDNKHLPSYSYNKTMFICFCI